MGGDTHTHPLRTLILPSGTPLYLYIKDSNTYSNMMKRVESKKCRSLYVITLRQCQKSILMPQYGILASSCFVCLFDLIIYVPSTIFQLNRDGSSWVVPVLSWDKCVLLKDQNAVAPVRLEPAAPWSRVKHSTTEPLHSPASSCDCANTDLV